MTIRPITPDYAVSPSISVTDVPAILHAGYKSIICNRPDEESLPEDKIAAISAAAAAAGLAFSQNPITHAGFGPDMIAEQAKLIETQPGPVLAYCASGTRSAIVWAFTQAGQMPTADILTAVRNQGYMLDHLAPALDRFGAAP